MKFLQSLLIIAAMSAVLTGCFPFAQFESARTVGHHNAAIGLTALGYVLYDPSSELANSSGYIAFPSVELRGDYGLSDKTDVRFMANMIGFVQADVKHMLVGDRQSKFSMSSGLGLSTWLPAFTNKGDPNVMIHLPIYMSWHYGNGMYTFINPKASYLQVFDGGSMKGNPFFGGTIGLGYYANNFELFGGLGPTFPFIKSVEDAEFASLYQLGVGLRYHIGK